MKKKLLSVALAFAMVVGILPAATVEAGSGKCSVSNIRQTAETTNSITFEWDDAAKETNRVEVFVYKEGNGNVSDEIEEYVNKDYFTVTGLPQNSHVEIDVYDSKGDYAYKLGGTAPGAISKIKHKSGFGKHYLDYPLYVTLEVSDMLENNIAFGGDSDDGHSYSGYHAEVYDKNNKLIMKSDYAKEDMDAYMTEIEFKNLAIDKMYKLIVRPYFIANKGTAYERRVTGPGKSFYAVPQPGLKVKTKDIKKSSIKMSWSKIKGAKSYSVYVAKSTKRLTGGRENKLKYKKVKTTTKTSYTLKKIGKNKINTKKYHYYICIVTNGVFKDKKVSSGKDFIFREPF